MKPTATILAAALWAIVAPGSLSAIELQRSTLDAWTDYTGTADQTMRARLNPGSSFLWIDDVASRALRLRNGEVFVAPVAGHGVQEVPNGLIHDWIGAAFIPDATPAGLLTILHDYESYPGLYKPAVTEAHPTGCALGGQEFSMTWQRHVLFVNAAMQARYLSRDVPVTPLRGYNISDSVRIQEIEDFGRTDQRLLPPGVGKGFMWRIHSIMRYEQRDGGLYAELEVMALTRDVPSSLRWLVNPVINHLSVDSLTTTLRQTRAAVQSLPAAVSYVPACAAAGGAEAIAARTR